MPQDWEQALGLIDMGLCPGATIMDGMRSVPPGRVDIMRAWERLWQRVQDLGEARQTLH